MAALHYLFAQKSRSAADDFMRRVITGVGIASNKDPEHAIRKWLLKDNMETGGRTNNTYRAAYVVLAWNSRRNGKPIKIFRWRTDQRSEERRVGNECVRPCRYGWAPSH